MDKKKDPAVVIKGPKKEEYEVLVEWKAPLRIFVKRDKKFFRKILTVALVVALIMLFIREFMFIGVILSLIFVLYVLSTVPPEEVTHKITTNGVNFAGHEYSWFEIANFYFTKKGDVNILNLTLHSGVSKKIPIILSDKVSKEELRKILSKRTKFLEKPPEDLLDKLSEKAAKKLSLN